MYQSCGSRSMSWGGGCISTLAPLEHARSVPFDFKTRALSYPSSPPMLRDTTMRAALLLLLLAVPLQAAERSADVVVYGGTAGGCVAAIAAAREGKTVILL